MMTAWKSLTPKEETILFRDRKGRQRYAEPSFDGRDYRILTEDGRYLWNASTTLLRNLDHVELPEPKARRTA